MEPPSDSGEASANAPSGDAHRPTTYTPSEGISSDVYLVEIDDLVADDVAVAGGKGANLGALSRIDGIKVPEGFVVTTNAFREIVSTEAAIESLLQQLGQLRPHQKTERQRVDPDPAGLAKIGSELRRAIERLALPDALSAEIATRVRRFGADAMLAVRSSATSEDLPSTSFAGQHDTFLQICGAESVIRHILLCWASLFTDRSITYRLLNELDPHDAQMAVVVQLMTSPQASGVMFTADPVTSNRRVVTIEATPGLGEALISGSVLPETFCIRDDDLEAQGPNTSTLSSRQALELARLGRRIETSFGEPQDIEWCLADDELWFVQTRPITTLFPIPKVADDKNHVYVSVGHQQMMTDAMKPLGLSIWLMTTRAPMHQSGGRLFVDVTAQLTNPDTRNQFIEGFGRADPLIGDAFEILVSRGDFLDVPPTEATVGASTKHAATNHVGNQDTKIPNDPAIVEGLIAKSEASIADLRRDIQGVSGTALLDFIRADMEELRGLLFDPLSHDAIMAGMEATWWLNDHLEEWLNERNLADVLSQSVPDNVTSEMGLALLDAADDVRRHPDVVEFLQNFVSATPQLDDDGARFLDRLEYVAGGRSVRGTIQHFLDTYGMRCAGEIDITRPRWSERPATLLPAILSNVASFDAGAGPRRFKEGEAAAEQARAEVLARIQALPDGKAKAAETAWMIDRVRTFAGYREYPKFAIIKRYFVYKQALLLEAWRLVEDGAIDEASDIYYLSFDELEDAVRSRIVDREVIRLRKAEFRSHQMLQPPRVITSDGEVITGRYKERDSPPGALMGLGVSGGSVEGRARVVLDLTDAEIESGDILVTKFTDPSWTALFALVSGLVTEVGGLMTHGAVIAREYGLPAVVGVERATELIRDGQRIRVDGTDGNVEILE